MDKFPPPPQLDFTGNVADNWKKFKQRFELYIEAGEKTTASDKTKNAILLTVAGAEAIDVFNTFTFTEADHVSETDTTPKHSAVIAKFEAHCSPQQNETYERYIFRSTMQQALQPIDKYITDVKNRAKTCNYGTLESSLIRDQIVIGVKDVKLKERLLREPDLTLAKTEQLCHAAEAVHHQIRSLNIGEKSQRVDGIRAASVTENSRATFEHNAGSRQKSTTRAFLCKKCNTTHKQRNCPAHGVRCGKCKGWNHYTNCCPSQSSSNTGTRKVAVVQASNARDADSQEEDDPEFFITCIETQTTTQEDGVYYENELNVKDACMNWMVQVSANNCLLSLKVDTGAQINVISMADLAPLTPRPRILKRKVTLKSYQGQVIPCKGLCVLNISIASGVIPALFAVVPKSFQ